MRKSLPLLFCLATLLSCEQSPEVLQVINLIENDDLHDIEAISDQTAVAYSYGTGNFYRTESSGNDWQLIGQLDSLYFEQIQFIDTKTGYVCGEQGSVYKTQDGGTNWQSIAPEIAEKDGNLLLYALYFENESQGMVAGLWVNFQTRKRKIYAFRTENGGKTWQEEEAPTMLLNIIKGPKGHYWGMGSGMILKKQTWDSPWETVLEGSDEQAISDIRSLDFGDRPGHIIAADFHRGNVWTSLDNGTHWEMRYITNNRLRSIKRHGKQDWLLVGDQNKEEGHVFRSFDDGVTWERDSTKMPDLHRLALSESYVWAVGKSGVVAQLPR